jgi:3,2-trans-enoyl-CoA isomerase
MNMLEITEHSPAAGAAAAIREIRLARPPVNALNGELLDRLVDAIEGAGSAGALVITGQPGVFSAGLDVPGMLKLDRDGIVEVFARLWHAQRAIATSPVPVVFGLTGHCPAGGTVLAIHGDYRVMAGAGMAGTAAMARGAREEGEFRLGLNEVQVGLYPGPLIHGAFRRLVGGHAAQLLTRGALIDPATALRVGLVDELCETSRCATRALEVARELCALPREAMLRTRQLARRDLVEMFGDPSHAQALGQQFGEFAADMWHSPETLARLTNLFGR